MEFPARGRQAGQVERDATQEDFRVGGRPGLEPAPRLFGGKERIDGVSGLDTGNRRPKRTLESPVIVVPPSHVVVAFNSIAETVRKRHEEMFEESRTLAAVRNTLLPKFVSGTLLVKNPEKFIGR